MEHELNTDLEPHHRPLSVFNPCSIRGSDLPFRTRVNSAGNLVGAEQGRILKFLVSSVD